MSHIQTVVFDCDGVILNSNRIKTDAFRSVVRDHGYDEEAAESLVQYHVLHGGVSRYQKFEYFLNNIVPRESSGPRLEDLLASYGSAVRGGLLECEIAEGIPELRQATSNAKWLIVSGGDQAELREVFQARGLQSLFDGGIFGSPNTKFDIVASELAAGNILKPALMLGDSRLDHEVADSFGIDFVFIFDWTEFRDWRDYVSANEIRSFATVKDALITHLSLAD